MIGKSFLPPRRAFSLSSKSRLSTPAMSPPGTACLDIFSPAPGDSEVISQVERLSSNDTKIAPRSVRIAADMSGRGMMRCMIVSEVRVEATSLCLGAGRYPFPMGSQPGREHLAVPPRKLALQPHLQIIPRHSRPLLLRLEQARRAALAHHIHRLARLGPSVLITESWYYWAQRLHAPWAMARHGASKASSAIPMPCRGRRVVSSRRPAVG